MQSVQGRIGLTVASNAAPVAAASVAAASVAAASAAATSAVAVPATVAPAATAPHQQWLHQQRLRQHLRQLLRQLLQQSNTLFLIESLSSQYIISILKLWQGPKAVANPVIGLQAMVDPIPTLGLGTHPSRSVANALMGIPVSVVGGSTLWTWCFNAFSLGNLVHLSQKLSSHLSQKLSREVDQKLGQKLGQKLSQKLGQKFG